MSGGKAGGSSKSSAAKGRVSKMKKQGSKSKSTKDLFDAAANAGAPF